MPKLAPERKHVNKMEAQAITVKGDILKQYMNKRRKTKTFTLALGGPQDTLTADDINDNHYYQIYEGRYGMEVLRMEVVTVYDDLVKAVNKGLV